MRELLADESYNGVIKECKLSEISRIEMGSHGEGS